MFGGRGEKAMVFPPRARSEDLTQRPPGKWTCWPPWCWLAPGPPADPGIPPASLGGGAITSPQQVTKHRHREVKGLAQGHTAGEGGAGTCPGGWLQISVCPMVRLQPALHGPRGAPPQDAQEGPPMPPCAGPACGTLSAEPVSTRPSRSVSPFHSRAPFLLLPPAPPLSPHLPFIPFQKTNFWFY